MSPIIFKKLNLFSAGQAVMAGWTGCRKGCRVVVGSRAGSTGPDNGEGDGEGAQHDGGHKQFPQPCKCCRCKMMALMFESIVGFNAL